MYSKHVYAQFCHALKTNGYWLVLPLFFMNSFSGFSQSAMGMENAVIDSLNKASNPTVKENRHLGLEHYQKLLNNSIANKHRKGIIESNYNLGRYYGFIAQQRDSAMFFFDQAILTIKKTGVQREKLYSAYNEKAIVLAMGGMEFLALEPFEKAYEAALNNADNGEIMDSKINLATLNRVLKNYDTSISLANELLTETPDLQNITKSALYRTLASNFIMSNNPKKGLYYLKLSDSVYQGKRRTDGSIVNKRTWMAKAYLDLGNFKKAIQICEDIFIAFSDLDGSGSLHFTHRVFGKALIEDGQTSKAIQILEDGLNLSGGVEEHIEILETLGFLYLSLKNYKKSSPLLTKAIHMRDSIQTSRTKQFSKYSSISYDLLETEYKNESLSHENDVLATKAKEREYIVSLLIMSVAVLILLIVGYVLWKKYYSGKKTIISLKANEKKILESHIKLREDELSATMEYLSKSMETLNAITTDLETTIKNKDYKALGSIHRSLREHQASSSATSLLTDRVESQYPRMTAQLLEMFPSFTANDVKHCIMIKLGLSLKETAQLFNISIAAVKSARGRMRKKMDLDPNVSLKQHMSFIAQSA